MSWWTRVKESVGIGWTEPQGIDAHGVAGPATRLDCGHVSGSYATDPTTGQTACLPCYGRTMPYDAEPV